MATIDFYEKPGCLNNTRQKNLLIEAGHHLRVHDLLKQPWSEDPQKLRAFFGDLPVAEWFNQSAPAIKNGEVIPERLNAEQAIELMIVSPILIRRPLMEINGRRQCGFDAERITQWLDLPSQAETADLETCSNSKKNKPCP